jgi:hypothetical protein
MAQCASLIAPYELLALPLAQYFNVDPHLSFWLTFLAFGGLPELPAVADDAQVTEDGLLVALRNFWPSTTAQYMERHSLRLALQCGRPR